jgi:hypothetical protein
VRRAESFAAGERSRRGRFVAAPQQLTCATGARTAESWAQDVLAGSLTSAEYLNRCDHSCRVAGGLRDSRRGPSLARPRPVGPLPSTCSTGHEQIATARRCQGGRRTFPRRPGHGSGPEPPGKEESYSGFCRTPVSLSL